MKRKSAILPYRFNKEELEILLIQNSNQTKWVIPKGTIETPLRPAISAAKEAYEEAGVLGIPFPIMIGTYHKNQQEVPTFLLKVELVMDHYDEQEIRERCWHKPSDITSLVVDEDLDLLIKRGIKIINKNGHYFKHGIRYFCAENNIKAQKIGKKKALLSLPVSNAKNKEVFINRSKSNVEFLVPSKFSFDSLEKVPEEFVKQFLLENSKPQMGSWALKEDQNLKKYTLYRLRNEELKGLNSAVFNTIVTKLTYDCEVFEKRHYDNWQARTKN